MKNGKRNWLILAHCFNMDGRAASQTITDKIPFLMKNGIAPIVVSAPTGIRDKKFVHHQILSPAPSGINFELRKIIEKKYQTGKVSQLLKAFVTISCLPLLLLEKIFIHLDSHWSWFITAGLKSCFLIRKYKPHVIYTTAGPSSTHLTGYFLNKIFNIPWVAEIHDPLIPEIGSLGYQRQIFHRWLEKIIFRHAKAVIYFTHSARENAQRRTKIFHNSYVLRPGATPPEIQNGITYRKRDQIHFGHFGSLAPERNLSMFIKAFDSLFKKEPDLKKKVILDVYGTNLDPLSEKAATQSFLDGVICEHGRLEYDPATGKSGRQQVFEQMYLCDVLVIVHGHTEICAEYIPSKMYEYLLTKRPILGIASPESELGQTLISGGRHMVVENNLDAIETAVRNMIEDWEKDQLKEIENTEGFTVEDAVKKLMDVVSA